MPSTFEGMRGNPLLGLTGDGGEGLKVIEAKRGAIEPCSDLSPSGAGESQRTFHGGKRSGVRARARSLKHHRGVLQCHLPT
jgi:hypothetical protein